MQAYAQTNLQTAEYRLTQPKPRIVLCDCGAKATKRIYDAATSTTRNVCQECQK